MSTSCLCPQDFTVIERENKVLGCALLVPLGRDDEGVEVAEVGAFCVDPQFQGSGRGDSLLDFVEQEARRRGVQRLVLLTTRTADWFEQRDFKYIGEGASTLARSCSGSYLMSCIWFASMRI